MEHEFPLDEADEGFITDDEAASLPAFSLSQSTTLVNLFFEEFARQVNAAEAEAEAGKQETDEPFKTPDDEDDEPDFGVGT